MELGGRTYGSVVVLAPVGRIDHNSADAFKDALMPHVELCTDDGVKLLLDMGQVDYMSSVGLRVLMIAAQASRKQNGTIVITGLGETLEEIFKISRFDKVFQIHPSVAEAMQSVDPEAAAAYQTATSGG